MAIPTSNSSEQTDMRAGAASPGNIRTRFCKNSPSKTGKRRSMAPDFPCSPDSPETRLPVLRSAFALFLPSLFPRMKSGERDAPGGFSRKGLRNSLVAYRNICRASGVALPGEISRAVLPPSAIRQRRFRAETTLPFRLPLSKQKGRAAQKEPQDIRSPFCRIKKHRERRRNRKFRMLSRCLFCRGRSPDVPEHD